MLTSTLAMIQFYLTQYGMILCLILGNIGNGYVIYFFKKRRSNTCSTYLSSASMMNILFLTINVPLLVYSNALGDPTSKSIVLCKIRYFLPHVVGQIARYYLVLACIDRFARSRMHSRCRSSLQMKTSRYLMIVTSIILCLLAVHIPIFTTIINGQCGQFATYYNVYLAHIIIFVSTIPPVTMAIFGYLAHRNMTALHARLQSLRMRTKKGFTRRRDRRLSRMVMAEVTVYLVTMSAYPLILFEVGITRNLRIQKSVNYLAIESFLIFISTFLGYINHAAPFYIYFVASKSFRYRVRRLFRRRRQ